MFDLQFLGLSFLKQREKTCERHANNSDHSLHHVSEATVVFKGFLAEVVI